VMLSTNISINGLKLVRLVQIKILRERKEIWLIFTNSSKVVWKEIKAAEIGVVANLVED
jgi:hypothetical protein